MDAEKRLDQIAQGYREAVVLLTACRMGLFEPLSDKTLTAQALAESLGLDARAVETVLLALAGLGIVERRDEAFVLAEDYAPLLTLDSPRSRASILSHNHNVMQRWARLDEVMRTGAPAPQAQEQRSGEELRHFICGMADISCRSSREVLEQVDLSPFRRMLDLGGGPATSSLVFAEAHPELHCVVFDLPEPIAIAREEIARAGLGDRVTTREGDFLKDDFGSGFDLVYISNVVHMLGPDDAAMLARKAAAALEPGGVVIVKDFFLDPTRTQPAAAALFSVNMLVSTEAGKAYTWGETEAILNEAGFSDFERKPVATASGLLVGWK